MIQPSDLDQLLVEETSSDHSHEQDALQAQVNRIKSNLLEVFEAKDLPSAQDQLLRCGNLILLSYRFAHNHGKDSELITEALVTLLRETGSQNPNVDRWIKTSIYNCIRTAQHILQG